MTINKVNKNNPGLLGLPLLSQDTLTLSFKGQKNQSLEAAKAKIEARLRPLEEAYFNESFSDGELKNQFNLAIKILNVFENARNKGIKIDINSEKYINKAKEVFSSPVNGSNKENLMNATFFLTTEAYELFDDKAQKSFERILLPLARTRVTNFSHQAAIDFYRNQDKHQDRDYRKLLELTAKFHNIKDTTSNEYMAIREQLLQQEFTILFQEVFDTENYLDRSIKMFALNSLPENREKATVKLQENSFSALISLLYISKVLDIKANTVSYDELTDKIFSLIDTYDNSEAYKPLKKKAFSLFKRIFKDLNPQNKARVIKMAVKLDNIEFIQKHVDKSNPVFPQLRKDYLTRYHALDTTLKDKNTAFINLTRLKEPSVKDLIKQIISNSQSDHLLKLSAVWAAGSYLTNANKNLLLEIIEPEKPVNKTNTSENDLELKEMALYSLAEYKDKSIDEVLNTIINSKSELSELALELTLVRKHSLEKIKDYFIKAYSLSPKMQKEYEKSRKEFIPHIDALSLVAKNWVDKALIPFRKFVKDLSQEGTKVFVMNDLVTTIDKDYTAQRKGYGFFWDNAPALAGNAGIMIVKNNFDLPPDKDFLFGHEFGHKLLGNLYEHKPAIFKQVQQLYKKAKQEDSFMDHYSAVTIGEYFAQANEAFLSIYKSHSQIIKSNDYDDLSTNTKYTLRRKDPELFKIFNKMYGKFAHLPVKTN